MTVYVDSYMRPSFIGRSKIKTYMTTYDNINNDNNNNNSTKTGLSFFGMSAEEFIESTSADAQILSEVAQIPTGPLLRSDNNQDQDNAAATTIRQYSGREIDNKYYKIVDKLEPNEMLQKFARNAPPNVQEAAKSTIVNILGSLPNYALDASLMTTNVKLANLMFQMEVTGYMLKNAEYRMSLTRSLKGLPKLPPSAKINDGNTTISLSDAKVEGKVTIQNSQGEKIEMEAAELTASLSKEVDDLRKEMALIRSDRETELRSNLLTYIQALPERDLARLTSDMSEEVMESIQLLVDALMEKLGVESSGPMGEEIVIQQSVSVLAQLCMWQICVGYKLRELEALEKGVALD